MAKKPSAPVSGFNPEDIELERQLVFPTLQVQPGVPVFVRVLEAMFQGRQLEEATPGKPVRGPATILKVHVFHGGKDDHQLNGKDAQIVANKLLVGVLKDNYPDDKYVGKCFKIIKSSSKKAGKAGSEGYYTFECYEFKDPQA